MAADDQEAADLLQLAVQRLRALGNPRAVALAESIEAGQARYAAEVECTGITATWCPIHGDCACPPHEEYSPEYGRTLNDPRCPLHAPTSSHGES